MSKNFYAKSKSKGRFSKVGCIIRIGGGTALQIAPKAERDCGVEDGFVFKGRYTAAKLGKGRVCKLRCILTHQREEKGICAELLCQRLQKCHRVGATVWKHQMAYDGAAQATSK